MQLRLDAADRLVELVEERRGPVAADDAARAVLKLDAPVSVGLARSLLAEAVEADGRLRWAGDLVALAAAPGEQLLLEHATYVVFDLDTVGLARRLLGRQPANLAALSYRFVTQARPCHRALPDAEATAEILLCLIGLAQERGARTVADLVELSATRPRRAHRKRSLAFGAPQRPGVYLFRDANDQVLYVGRARDLRARLRSYFRSERQRPAVEAALSAVERIEWRVLGSELEAALEELRLLRELRPPANARSARPDRYVYLGVRRDRVAVTRTPTPHGPLKSRRRAELAARALEPGELDRPREALPPLRAKLKRLARDLRY